jgi:uncharacterized protein (DUF924 family)
MSEAMYQSILQFWFQEITAEQWWKSDPAFDQLIKDRFGEIHQHATRAELFAWRPEPHGRLAEVIVLDQFSRNIFRANRRAFENDALALALAQEAIAAKADTALSPAERSFLYVPFMHSESRAIHKLSERLFRDNAYANSVDFALRHKAIIDRFGRYPHRNAAIGRESTAEEIEFLQQPGSGF